jgi:ribulose-5-phosphate 4-epimerase/fuculose-1-phosphate aldolase
LYTIAEIGYFKRRRTGMASKAGKSATRGAAALRALIDDVVAANRILANQGVLDAYGHVSARHPHDPTRFLISRSLAPELVAAKDIMDLDFDGNPPKGDPRSSYLERFIHAEIYRARPDVMAVVHSHAPSVIPFASSQIKLRPIYHMSGFLRAGPSVFDIRRKFGNTDMLVRNRAQGVALAKTLAGDSVALMRGHGYVAVAASVAVVAYRAIYTERNALLQQSSLAMGGAIRFLNDEEAVLAEASVRGTITRPWELWKKKALSA